MYNDTLVIAGNMAGKLRVTAPLHLTASKLVGILQLKMKND